MVGEEQRADGGRIGEQVEDDLLFAGPGVGEDDVEVVGVEFEFYVAVVAGRW